MSSLLPLFPLDLVLLPRNNLPLHIFEPRYKEMINECVEQNRPFGVVRAKEDEGIAEIGCTAEIDSIVKKYPDGRMDILTHGSRRFEVMHVVTERAFLQAEPMYFEDEQDRPTQDETDHALELHNDIFKLAGAEPQKFDEEGQLSFQLAGRLPLDLDFKQTLLGMKSEAERIRSLSQYLETILPTLRRTVQVRSKAGGNGHAV